MIFAFVSVPLAISWDKNKVKDAGKAISKEVGKAVGGIGAKEAYDKYKDSKEKDKKKK